MLRCIKLLRLLPFLLCLLISKVDAYDDKRYWFDRVPVEDLDFSYAGDEPSKWSDVYHRCGYPEQSPIMLSSKNTTPLDVHLRVDIVQFSEAHVHKAFLHNTGKVLIAYFGNDELVVTVNENSYFNATEMYFHWPSEHVLNGKRYPLEIQIRFTAVRERDPLRIQDTEIHFPNFEMMFSILFDVCEKLPMGDIEMVAESMLNVTQPGEKIHIAIWMPAYITQFQEGKCYLMYMGTQTTPPCQAIPWFVSTVRRCMTQPEFDAFENQMFGYGNRSMRGASRPLQPLEGRTIYSLRNENCDAITTI